MAILTETKRFHPTSCPSFLRRYSPTFRATIKPGLYLIASALILLLLKTHPAHSAPHPQSPLADAIEAVVRIVPQRCVLTSCQPQGLGSGVFIHPSGVILTAWHVTVLTVGTGVTAPHVYADEFVIEVADGDVGQPIPRYRARIIALHEEQDLALLQVFATLQGGAIPHDTRFPTLPISQEVPRTANLRLMGYPPAGGESITYPEVAQSGFDENGALIKVQARLSEGSSGGPALIEGATGYEIVGVVIRARGVGQEVGLIRNLHQSGGLDWRPAARQAWGENPHIELNGDGEGADVQLHIDLHLLDFATGQGQLVAYLFDAQTRAPLMAPIRTIPQSPSGQIAFAREIPTRRFVDSHLNMTLPIPLSRLNRTADDTLFKLVLWDARQGRVLWQTSEWLASQPARTDEVAAIDVPPVTGPSATVMSSVMSTPTPNLQATETAQADMMATTLAETLTALPSPTPPATPTPDVVATAVAATLTAQPTPTPNLAATQTADAEQFQAAVAATLAAQAASATPTSADAPPPSQPASPGTPVLAPGRVVFASDLDGFAHIFMMQMTTDSSLWAVTGGQNYHWNPAISSNGGQVAFASKVGQNTEIFVANSNGGSSQNVSNHPARDDHPAWFPGGAALVFASERDGPWELYRLDGGSVRRLTFAGGDNRFPDVSPTGGQIAFVALGGGYPTIQVMLMNADGSNLRPLFVYTSRFQRENADRYVYRPDWSPDGGRLAFGADTDDDGVIDIVTIDVVSGQATLLMNNGNNPAWSPNGQQFIFKRDVGEWQILYAATIDGRVFQQLSGSGYSAWSPDWIP